MFTITKVREELRRKEKETWNAMTKKKEVKNVCRSHIILNRWKLAKINACLHAWLIQFFKRIPGTKKRGDEKRNTIRQRLGRMIIFRR